MFAGMKKAGNTESTGRRNYRLLYLKGNTKGGEDGKIM